MSRDMFANTFSHRSGIEQSLMSTIITQQGLQNTFMDGGGIQSALSNIAPQGIQSLFSNLMGGNQQNQDGNVLDDIL
jgi:hypothetical protein